MDKTSFMDSIKEESKKYGASQGSDDFFNFEKGVNRIRILATPKVLALHFFGEGQKPVVCVGIDEGCELHQPIKGEDGQPKPAKKPTIKLATYVIDRKDGKIKMAELPLSISYSLNDLQEDQDFAFSEFPMPYDVKITYDPDNNDPKAKYRLVASPKQEEISDEEQKMLSEAMARMSPEQYVETRKNKTKGLSSKPEEQINPEEIPF